MAPYTTPFTFNVDDVFIPSLELDKSTRAKISDFNKRLKSLRIW